MTYNSQKWTLLAMVNWVAEYFAAKGISESRLNAEHIIAHALNISRLDIYLKFDLILTSEELTKIKVLIKRRATHEPLQHILETQPFRKVDICISNDALIPRPETEIVVEYALEKIPKDHPFKILEIGVGSGAICAAIAMERENVEIYGTDICEKALLIAKKNTKQFGDRIKLFQGDLFQPINTNKFDLIISNPPYIPDDIWETLEPEVKDFEPEIALKGGKDGLDFYRRILKDASKYLKKESHIILELGDNQAEAVSKIATDNGFTKIEIKKDFSDRERVILIRHAQCDVRSA